VELLYEEKQPIKLVYKEPTLYHSSTLLAPSSYHTNVTKYTRRLLPGYPSAPLWVLHGISLPDVLEHTLSSRS
jgi:hypothetical protein